MGRRDARRVLLDTTMNISSFGEDEQGELYVVDLGGTLSRIVGVVAVHVRDRADEPELRGGWRHRHRFGYGGTGCAWTAVAQRDMDPRHVGQRAAAATAPSAYTVDANTSDDVALGHADDRRQDASP